MTDYFLRCRESRYQTLLDRGQRMGVIRIDGGQVAPIGEGVWDYVGKKLLGDGSCLGDPDPYIHINFRTEHDLRQKAMEAAQAGDADIAQGLAEISSYFITDADGNVVPPAFPMKVFL